MKLPDDVWAVIVDYCKTYELPEATPLVRKFIEEETNIDLFDGGCFISYHNEFDIYVVPKKRGYWRIRSTGEDFLNKLGEKYGKVIARIDERNSASIRLAKFFGFREVNRSGSIIKMERVHKWER